ncbi:MAG: hypothetical protein K0B14_11620 [Anaerolineaceae bacterium]|nr:hypothetical protein [Anaerolineaceae bacterium]
MNDITLSILVILATGLLVILIFVLVRRNRFAKEKALAQMALERGWKLEVVREPLKYGQRIRHKEWVIELMTESTGRSSSTTGSSHVTATTTWRAPGRGSTLLIGPRYSQVNLGGLGEALLRQVLQKALGSEAEGLVEVKAGSDAFRKNFLIYARDPEDVQRLISPFLETTLMSWKKFGPIVKRTNQGLSIELPGTHFDKPGDIETLVKLGDIVLSQEY